MGEAEIEGYRWVTNLGRLEFDSIRIANKDWMRGLRDDAPYTNEEVARIFAYRLDREFKDILVTDAKLWPGGKAVYIKAI